MERSWQGFLFSTRYGLQSRLEDLWRSKPILLPFFLLLIGFFSLYLSIGIFFSKTSAFDEPDTLFGCDTPRVILDIAKFRANHERTNVHPLFVLLVNPFGVFLKLLIRSGMDSAVILNSFWGSAGAALSFLFFWLFSKNIFNSLLLSVLFGLSMSPLFFGSVPETYSLALCSLLCTHILFWVSVQKEKRSFPLWILAGVFSFSVNAINFAQTLVGFTLLTLSLSKGKKISRANGIAIVSFVGFVLGSAALLALVQKAIYPSSSLFFLPREAGKEFTFVTDLLLKKPSTIIPKILKEFFLINFIGPAPEVFQVPVRINPIARFPNTLQYSFIGWSGAVLWLGLLLGGVVKTCFSKRQTKLFFMGILLCLALNLALHSFYATQEIFVFSGNFTILVFLFLSHYSIWRSLFIRLVLMLLVLLAGFNNLMVIQTVLDGLSR